jgi:DNA-binding Lrp family transcriptional regulator
MGRRSDLENEFRPIEEKLVEIVASSDYRGIRFVDIVQLAEKAGISRPSVARHLNALTRRGIIKKDGVYKLAMEAVHWKHAQRSLFSVLAMHLFDDIFEKAGQGKLSDEEFIQLFARRVGTLAIYTLLVGISKAEKHPEEGGKWIEEAFGTLIQKDGWRSCLNRQIFGGVVKLKREIRLEQPLRPEIEMAEGTIFVRSPYAIQHGLAGKVLKELPPIPNNRVNLLKDCLKKLYPKETELLDDVLNLIVEAAAQSKRR